MANSISAYLWEDKDYQRTEHGKFWVFFFLMSHHLQHRQISHHPRQAVSIPPEASDIRKGED